MCVNFNNLHTCCPSQPYDGALFFCSANPTFDIHQICSMAARIERKFDRARWRFGVSRAGCRAASTRVVRMVGLAIDRQLQPPTRLLHYRALSTPSLTRHATCYTCTSTSRRNCILQALHHGIPILLREPKRRLCS
jgi:hypothetical protein